MKILDVTKPLDRTAIMLKLDPDEIGMIEEAISEFIRITAEHKVQAEYYGEEFLQRIAGLRDTFKELIEHTIAT